ncbi:MAG: hypothetical protein ABII08_04540 [Candidatus Beckwithbacteria bacterium]
MASRTAVDDIKRVEVTPILGQEMICITGKKCVVCRGDVVERFVYELVAPADWPASVFRNEFVSKGRYCNNRERDCGIKYEF